MAKGAPHTAYNIANLQEGGARLSVNSVLEEQTLWEKLFDAYEALPDEFKALVPEPGLSPLLNSTTRNLAANDTIEEARDAAGLLTPDEMEDFMADDIEYSPSMETVLKLYRESLPTISQSWLPVIIRADILSNVLELFNF
jgi:hypothetical protein